MTKKKTALFLLCCSGFFCNTSGMDPQAIIHFSAALLGTLSKRGSDSEKVKEILDNLPEVDARDERNRTPLHIVAAQGGIRKLFLSAALQALLKRGANVDAVDYKGASPLLTAVKADNFYVAQVLLAHGADPDLADLKGVQPLDIVLKEWQRIPLDVVRKVAKDHPAYKLKKFFTVLDEYRNGERQPIVKPISTTPTLDPQLLTQAIIAVLNAPDPDGITPLHRAVKRALRASRGIQKK